MRYLSERQAWLWLAYRYDKSDGYCDGICVTVDELRWCYHGLGIGPIVYKSMQAKIARKLASVRRAYEKKDWPYWLEIGFCWPDGDHAVRAKFCRQVAARLKPKKKA